MTSTEGLMVYQLTMCLLISCGIGIAIGWTWARWKDISATVEMAKRRGGKF